MQIIVPEGIEAIPSPRRRSYQLGLLRFVFRHQECGVSPGSLPHPPGHGGEDVICQRIIDVLGGSQAQAVER
jgi:hypothetical protein